MKLKDTIGKHKTTILIVAIGLIAVAAFNVMLAEPINDDVNDDAIIQLNDFEKSAAIGDFIHISAKINFPDDAEYGFRTLDGPLIRQVGYRSIADVDGEGNIILPMKVTSFGTYTLVMHQAAGSNTIASATFDVTDKNS